ncbi:MAG TPA: ABC transporter ATP-binding protein [Solirubrobacteraceae bacterium]|nr:ABC transporter ATP-binding protein [Solirubrobacteraceae bacterium]
MTSLDVHDLHKAFGANLVLAGVDLAVPAGSLTAILGPSGSGKTTLLRVIAGFEWPDRGTVALGGVPVAGAGEQVAPERRRIGYVPQEGSLFPHLDVQRNIAFGLPRRERRGERVRELLRMIGMEGLQRRYPHELSGGQQQRVALARALAPRPELVLLDEPFSSLDAALRASVRAEVAELLRTAGTTALLVTHDQDEALSLADRVAVIRDGRIGQCDSPRELYDAPRDAELAHFVGDANLLPGRLLAGRVRTALGDLPLLDGQAGGSTKAADGAMPGGAAKPGGAGMPGAGAMPGGGDAQDTGADAIVLIRPEQIRLSPEAAAGALTGRVLDCEYHGHDALLRVRAEGLDGAPVVLARAYGQEVAAPGATVGLAVAGPVVAWPRNGEG